MFIYPIVVALVILTFLHKLFGGRQCVYAWTIGLTLIPAFVTGLQTAKIPLGAVDTFFSTTVPLHSLGMSWLCFAVVGFVIGLAWKAAVSSKTAA